MFEINDDDYFDPSKLSFTAEFCSDDAYLKTIKYEGALDEEAREMTREGFLKTYGGDSKQYQFALDNRIKTVRRQIRNVEKSFENIAIGKFP